MASQHAPSCKTGVVTTEPQTSPGARAASSIHTPDDREDPRDSDCHHRRDILHDRDDPIGSQSSDSSEHGWALADLTRARVECCGTTHTLAMEGGRIVYSDHDPEELRRERVLRAMGAQPIPCGAAVSAWVEGDVDLLPTAWVELRSFLQQAIDTNDSQLMADLLAVGIHVGTRSRDGRPILHLLHRFDRSVVDQILDLSADPEVVDGAGRTPLRAAIENGAVEVVDAICTRGAQAWSIGTYSEPALLFTAQRIWARELDLELGVRIMHVLLDHEPGPYDLHEIAVRCAVAGQPSADLDLASATTRRMGPSGETVHATRNHLATRLVEIAMKAEDERLLGRLAHAGLAVWVEDDPTFGPDEKALRQLVDDVVEDGSREEDPP